ncbi:hypothetical protein GCM10028803_00250 [Larkinella knui]|uniref:Uncharacterized protein n=1 Tax=Larkinella knui TaxID=2025310 RepID=A0A3P1CJC6_9BACT|nr:hypothetical protein [Larkinella knui]RRB13433.1 hypothetical protein EHT87_14245 [Larkinella knui]
MAPWLTQADFSNRLPGGLPASFDATEKLGPIVLDIVDDWLTDLLGETKVGELRTYLQASGTGNAGLEDLKKVVIPFLVFAAWSSFVVDGNVTVTQTGLVSKNNDYSTQIESRQLTQISIKYRGKAERYARKVAKLKAPETCVPARSAVRPRLRKAQRTDNSYFRP